ncbi:hypothetical protein J2129_000834 [Methanofollis sp. W23]|nr:hypothetical protein [Methanofollis sp. W23]
MILGGITAKSKSKHELLSDMLRAEFVHSSILRFAIGTVDPPVTIGIRVGGIGTVA